MQTEEKVHRLCKYPVAEAVLQAHRTFFHAAQTVRCYEVQLFFHKQVRKSGNIGGRVCRVSVKGCDNISGGPLEAGFVGSSVSPSRLVDYPCPFLFSDFPCPVLRVRIHHEYLVIAPFQSPVYLVQHLSYGLFLVHRRYYHGNLHDWGILRLDI